MTDAKSRAESLIKEWLDLDFWPATRAKALQLLTDESYLKIQRDFNQQHRIEFNTHGLQGEYGPGFNKLNELVIAQTAQSVYYYCLRVIGETELKMHGVGIGYDWSPHAKDFARISAAVFLLHGVRVYMVSEPASAAYTRYLDKYYMCGCGFIATETCTPQPECQYIVCGIGRGSLLSARHSKAISDMISIDNSHIFVPHPELQLLDKILEEGIKSRLLIMIDQDHEVSKAYYRELKPLKYFNREYQKRTKTSFRIGCFLMGAPDACVIANILQNIFLFSADAIQSRFFFFENAEFNTIPPEKYITTACEKSNTINSCIEANKTPPIKIIICTDINAEAIWLAELTNPECYPYEWHVYSREDVDAFVMNWCTRNLNSNPLVPENIEKCRRDNHYNIHSSIHTMQTNKIDTRYCIADLYNSIVHKDDKAYPEHSCGAVCAHYQGLHRPDNDIIIARDGAVILGIISELVIDLYEFSGSGSGIGIKRQDHKQLDSHTLGEYINSLSFKQNTGDVTAKFETTIYNYNLQ